MKKWFKRTLTFMFYGLIFLFLFFYLKKIDFEKLKTIELNWGLFWLAFLLSLAGKFFLPAAWNILIKKYSDVKISSVEVLHIYAVSWMGRYIPGKIAWIGGKISMAVEKGIDFSTATISSVLESFCQVFSTTLVGLIFLLMVNDLVELDQITYCIVLGVFFVMLIVLVPQVYNWLLGLGYRLLKKKELSRLYYMDLATILKVIGLIGFTKILSGIYVSTLTIALGASLDFRHSLYVIGSDSISAALGMAALIAPSGLGVIESSQIFLFSQILDKEIVLVLVVMIRLVNILSDLVYFLIAKIVYELSKKCLRKQ